MPPSPIYPGASINTSLTNRIIASLNATRRVIEDREKGVRSLEKSTLLLVFQTMALGRTSVFS